MLSINNINEYLNADRAAILVLLLAFFSYLVYWFGIKSRLFASLSTRIAAIQNSNFNQIFFGRIYGMVILGFLPLLVLLLSTEYTIHEIGLGIRPESVTTMLIWICTLGILIVLINYLNSSNENNLKTYPQVRMRNWSYTQVHLNLLSWTCYLVGYEILFRGVLLFPLYYSHGMIMAITINTIIYALVHLPKGIVETIGAIPLGVLFCVISLETGNIYVSLFVHIIMASSNFLFSLKKHPEMKIN